MKYMHTALIVVLSVAATFLVVVGAIVGGILLWNHIVDSSGGNPFR